MTASDHLHLAESTDAPLTNTPARLIASATQSLNEAGFDCARRDSELLMAHLLGCDVTELWRHAESLPGTQVSEYHNMISRRMTHEPVAHITGHQEFWSLLFGVTADTLVPRPDTETLVEVGLRLLQDSADACILDIGTGSGCVLISLLTECPTVHGTGLDISPAALQVAAGNALNLGVGGRANFFESDVLSALCQGSGADQKYDLIVSNPPYIESADIAFLMPDVAHFEPLSALDGGPDGLNFYRRITRDAGRYLTSGGALAMEVGHTQAGRVVSLLQEANYTDVQTHCDLAGIDRVVTGKKP